MKKENCLYKQFLLFLTMFSSLFFPDQSKGIIKRERVNEAGDAHNELSFGLLNKICITLKTEYVRKKFHRKRRLGLTLQHENWHSYENKSSLFPNLSFTSRCLAIREIPLPDDECRLYIHLFINIYRNKTINKYYPTQSRKMIYQLDN